MIDHVIAPLTELQTMRFLKKGVVPEMERDLEREEQRYQAIRADLWAKHYETLMVDADEWDAREFYRERAAHWRREYAAILRALEGEMA